ncbi:MAG: VanZ family protein [Phycisphaerae bacterium]|nr:VanZ family protein [Phycisphaerae bacterium]
MLRRRTLHCVALLMAGGVWYGTTMPFGVTAGSVPGGHAEPVGGGFTWVMRCDVDAWVNLFVYVPIGLFFRLVLRRRPARPLREVVLAVLGAAALSAVTEWSQVGVARRNASVNDLLFNSGGAFLGALIAPVFQSGLRRLHAVVLFGMRSRPLLWLSAGTAAALALAQLSTVGRDVGLRVVGGPPPFAAAARATMAPLEPASAPLAVNRANPIQAGALTAKAVPPASIGRWCAVLDPDSIAGVIRWVGFGIFGFLAMAAVAEAGRVHQVTIVMRFVGVVAIAAAMESLLWLSPFPRLDANHLFLSIGAAAVAACAAAVVLDRCGWDVVAAGIRPLPAWMVAGLGVLLLISGLGPFLTRQPAAGAVGLAWLPLHSEFPRAWMAWMLDGGVALVRFAIGAYLVASAAGRHANRVSTGQLMIIATGVYALVQFGGLQWTGRWMDTMALTLLLLAAAWAVRTYRAVTGDDADAVAVSSAVRK